MHPYPASRNSSSPLSKRGVWFAAAAVCVACAAAPRRVDAPAEKPPAAAAGAKPTAETAPAPVKLRPDLQQHFDAERVTGTIALFDTASGELGCSDATRCQRAVIPASTFKIPHALIALELGLLDDAESAMPWDGQTRAVAAWNQDHTLRSAMQVSCVPCFQAIARRVGPERMREWLVRLDFGNHAISGGIDRFWLDGGLRISPLQQLDFLQRLDRGTLPAKPKSLDVVRDVITLDVGFDHVFRGKSGWALPGDAEREYGWFVGWVELGERRMYFALLIDGHAPDVDIGPLRRRLAEKILRAEGALPRA